MRPSHAGFRTVTEEDAVRPLRSSINEPQVPASVSEESTRSTSYSRGGGEQLKRRTSSVRASQRGMQRQQSHGRAGSLHTIYASASMGARLPLSLLIQQQQPSGSWASSLSSTEYSEVGLPELTSTTIEDPEACHRQRFLPLLPCAALISCGRGSQACCYGNLISAAISVCTT